MLNKYMTNRAGFTFIEMAIVLVIVGILVGTGLTMFGKTLETSQRKDALARLEDDKSAFLLYVQYQGKTPKNPAYDARVKWYHLLGVTPWDVWNNEVKYVYSANIDTTLTNVCSRLTNPAVVASNWISLTDKTKTPEEVYSSAGGTAKNTIVALFVSGGAKNADNLGDLYDSTNGTGNPYVKDYLSENFDDLVVPITAAEMYEAMKDQCMALVTVVDGRSAPGSMYYLYNADTHQDVGSANWTNSVTARVPLNTNLEVHTDANGVGLAIKAQTVNANPTTINLP